MALVENEPLVWDPYDVEMVTDPYPVYRRLREEAPLYFNEEYDFYAVSRFDDVERGLKDHETFISGRGGILELIKADLEMPSGVVIFEDPPTHTLHRRLMSRMFTPRKVSELEDKIRQLCADALDPHVGSGGFDFVQDLGAIVPMQVIGMLLGIPEADQVEIRERTDARLRTEAGSPMTASTDFTNERFAEYLDWRVEHPSDDIMTELLHAEFEDTTGTTRTLTREEILTYISVVAGAGNETTTKLIGWAGKVLAEHADQRRQLVDDRGLVPAAVEELLRYEPPGPVIARYVAADAEFQGRPVPAGSAVLFLIAAANHDDERFVDGDRFDINREPLAHLTFGHGIHFCLGAALARIEGRVVLDEILQRFPEWEVDLDGARLASTSTVRGFETLPVLL